MKLHHLPWFAITATFFNVPLLLLGGVLLAAFPIALPAQSVSFAGSLSILPGSFSGPEGVDDGRSFSEPQGVAVDGSGNVFVADTGNSAVKEILAAGGYTTVNTIGSGFFYPYGVAVDRSGNVFVADTFHNAVKEILAAGNYATVSTLGSGFSSPVSVAVDGSGNVFVADLSNDAVKEILAVGDYTTVKTLGSGFDGPEGVAVDGSGNVFVADTLAVKEILAAGDYATVKTLGNFSAPFGVAVDESDNVFVAVYGEGAIKEILAAGGYTTVDTLGGNLIGSPIGVAVSEGGHVFVTFPSVDLVAELQLGSVNFGSANVCPSGLTIPAPCSSTQTLNYNVAANTTIGSIKVLTQGAPNLDFTLTPSSPCSGEVPVRLICVNVTFAPTAPGQRNGAVQILDGAGHVLATTYVYGTGQGPQLTFPPGAQSALSLGNLAGPYSIAVDAAGNLYIAEAISAYSPGNGVVKETWSGSGYTQSTVASGLAYPVGVAVDGAGNVYIADQDAGQVLIETPTNGGYAQSVLFSGLRSIEAIAVDGSGNVYISSLAYGLLKETLIAGGYSQSTIASGVYAFGIAVDGQGNVYLGDSTNNQVLLEAPSSGNYTQSTIATGLNGPHGLTVDAIGNVYIANTFGGQILKASPSDGVYTQSTVASGLNDPEGVTIDGSGNIFFSSDPANSVWKIDYADPPNLAFLSTTVGHTSSDSPQSVQFQNIGNVALTGSGALSDIIDFLEVPGPGTVPDCAESIALAPGALCNLSFSFIPQSAGQLHSTLTLSDNSLNGNPAIQQVQLSGTGVALTPQISAISPNYGAPAALIKISGTGFGATQGNSSVAVGAAPSSNVVSWSNTLIAIQVPSNATTGCIVVTVGGISSNCAAFTFYPYPAIAGVWPVSGPVGTLVTINGTGLIDGEGNGVVTFNGTPAKILSTPTSTGILQVDVPAGATTGPISVHANGDTVKTFGDFTVIPPQISGISPNYGAPAALIKITGNNFGASQGNGSVTVGGAQARVVSWMNTLISITVPSNATTGNIVVTAGGETSNGVPFSFHPYPAIAGVWPVSGSVETLVTINGTGLIDGEGNGVVTFNGTPATILSQSSTTGILQVDVPAGATTGPISVHANGDTVKTLGDFTVDTSVNQRDQP